MILLRLTCLTSFVTETPFFLDILMYNLFVGIPLPTLPLYLPISILVADLCTFFVTSFFVTFLVLVCVLVNVPFLEVVLRAT